MWLGFNLYKCTLNVKAWLHDIYQYVSLIKAHELSFWSIWFLDLFYEMQLEIKLSKLQFYHCDVMLTCTWDANVVKW